MSVCARSRQTANILFFWRFVGFVFFPTSGNLELVSCRLPFHSSKSIVVRYRPVCKFKGEKILFIYFSLQTIYHIHLKKNSEKLRKGKKRMQLEKTSACSFKGGLSEFFFHKNHLRTTIGPMM